MKDDHHSLPATESLIFMVRGSSENMRNWDVHGILQATLALQQICELTYASGSGGFKMNGKSDSISPVNKQSQEFDRISEH